LLLQLRNDLVDVIDAAAPDASAGLHQRGPETGVVGQQGMRMQVRARLALRQAARAFFRAEDLIGVSHEMERAGQRFAIDDDFDLVAF
jgi:hypothetical protein